jgi:protein-disulfide isomerase
MRRTASIFALALAGLAAGASACLTNPPPSEFTPEPLPTLDASPTTPPQELAGVDTKALTDREKESWWRLVSRILAPCRDQAVSVAQCIQETRPCNACVPVAKFIADRVHAGDSTADAEQAAAARFGTDVRSIDVADSPTRGSASAPVTIVVWGDFECPSCGRMVPLLDQVFESYPEHVRLVHKFYPLSKHPNAMPAAQAAWAAQRQGKYWEFERKLFANQAALADTDLVRYANELKLDVQRFDADRKSDAAKSTIERDKAAADKAGLSGTPHVMINGRHFVAFADPAKDLDDWVALEIELARGKPVQGKAPAAVPAAETAPAPSQIQTPPAPNAR